MKRFLALFMGSTLVVITVTVVLAFSWLNRPLLTDGGARELTVASGEGASATARSLGRLSPSASRLQESLFLAWMKWSAASKSIKAGTYAIEPSETPQQIVTKLVKGDQKLVLVTLVEGWNFRQVLAAVSRTKGLRSTLQTTDSQQLMRDLGRPNVFPEGRFFPDTYAVALGSSDADVLKLAMSTMDNRVDQAWAQRDTATPLKTKEDALILASIVEKETGKPEDRSQIAGVFINRLRIGMLLQTDPTVIYGLGDQFDGNLKRVHLRTDTPYNTYTRGGLPPTPIAAPGWAALLAAVKPQPTDSLYFVAKGDGGSAFSRTLAEHNRAVNKYQRGQ